MIRKLLMLMLLPLAVAADRRNSRDGEAPGRQRVDFASPVSTRRSIKTSSTR